MSRIENLLRAATRDTAAEVDPDSIPGLDLTTVTRPRHVAGRLRVPIGPLIAGAAIALIAAATIGTRAYERSAPASSDGTPPYYLSLIPTGSSWPNYTGATLNVVSTFSGATLTSVRPPRGYANFTIVAGTGDDSKFLVGAVPPGHGNTVMPTRLFTLTYQPGANTVSLTRLPVPPVANLATASLSPDRRYLAVEAKDILWIYNLHAGTHHSWKAGDHGAFITSSRDPRDLSWTADDKTLSVIWGNEYLGEEVRLLDSGNQGDDLSRDSRGLIRLGYSGWACTSDPFISTDGSVVLCGGYTDTTGTPSWLSSTTTIVTTGFGEFSATTGKMIAILDPERQRLPAIRAPLNSGGSSVDATKLPRLFWASPDASTLIGTRNGKAFMFRDGQEQPIAWTRGIGTSFTWQPLTGVAW